MTAPWTMTVEVGSHSWTVDNLDPATPGPTAPLLMRHSLPDDQPWPSQPQPPTATFGLIAATAAELADVVEGASVHLTFTAPPNPDPATFDGDITDVELEPATFTPAPGADPVDGVRATITALGYLAQLWEEPVTTNELGDFTSSEERLWNLFEFTRWPDGFTFPGYPSPPFVDNWFPDPSHLELHVAGESLGPHMDKLLRTWLWDVGNDGRLQRLVAVPNLDPVTRQLDATVPWRMDLVGNGVTLTPVGTFAATPTGWGVVVDAATAGVLDSGRVAKDVRFVQRKRSNLSKVLVSYTEYATEKVRSLSVNNGNTPTVTTTIETDYQQLDAGDMAALTDIAGFYLPAGHADAWGVETVQWRLHADDPGQTPPELGELVVIGPVSESVNPNGRTWITGLVRAWTLTLPDATVDLELVTARGVTTPEVAGDRLTWAQLPAANPTWAQLRPDHTWEDYDLLKGP